MKHILDKTIIIITARKGSKGVWNKNIHPLMGKPLISYCINAAIKTGITTYVSTNDDAVRVIAEEIGVHVIDRCPLNALSQSPSVSNVMEVLDKISIKPEFIILVQPTSPMINEIDILEVLSKLCSDDYDTVFTAFCSHFKTWTDARNQLEPMNHSRKKRETRQKSKPLIIENGAVYATKYKSIKKNKMLISGKVGYIEVPKIRSFEIDSYEDIQILEAILGYEKNFFDIK